MTVRICDQSEPASGSQSQRGDALRLHAFQDLTSAPGLLLRSVSSDPCCALLLVVARLGQFDAGQILAVVVKADPGGSVDIRRSLIDLNRLFAGRGPLGRAEHSCIVLRIPVFWPGMSVLPRISPAARGTSYGPRADPLIVRAVARARCCARHIPVDPTHSNRLPLPRKPNDGLKRACVCRTGPVVLRWHPRSRRADGRPSASPRSNVLPRALRGYAARADDHLVSPSPSAKCFGSLTCSHGATGWAPRPDPAGRRSDPPRSGPGLNLARHDIVDRPHPGREPECPTAALPLTGFSIRSAARGRPRRGARADPGKSPACSVRAHHPACNDFRARSAILNDRAGRRPFLFFGRRARLWQARVLRSLLPGGRGGVLEPALRETCR